MKSENRSCFECPNRRLRFKACLGMMCWTDCVCYVRLNHQEPDLDLADLRHLSLLVPEKGIQPCLRGEQLHESSLHKMGTVENLV